MKAGGGAWLRRRLFGIAAKETRFAHRGFSGGTPQVRERLEYIGETFVYGYHAALAEDEIQALVETLECVPLEGRGFAYEGAAMALALLDRLTPWRGDRLDALLNSTTGTAHAYMVHVGAGWTLARVPGGVTRLLSRLDPLLRWLALDGYGFHEGYFHSRASVEGQRVPRRLSGYARRAFDQGLGRSLWFVRGAEVVRIAETVGAFPIARQADLWSGVGLACAYAGGIEREAIAALRGYAGSYAPQLAQGAAFAAQARQRAGNPVAPTEMACAVLCGLSAAAAAKVTDTALERLPADGVEPAYEVWRQRIQMDFTGGCENIPHHREDDGGQDVKIPQGSGSVANCVT